MRNIFFGFLLGVMNIPSLALAQWSPGGANASANLPSESIYRIIENFMLWLLAIVGFLAVIGFAISGVLYLTAAGSEDQIGQAKRAMTWSIVGVIVSIIGVVVMNAVDLWLSGGNTTF
jgi:heme/copper-type cytochrome/quinol oxidase subunit 2